jgi:hypothetical protein
MGAEACLNLVRWYGRGHCALGWRPKAALDRYPDSPYKPADLSEMAECIHSQPWNCPSVSCLGAKDVTGLQVTEGRALLAFTRRFFSAHAGQPLEAPAELARHLVLGSVEYVRGLGFAPAPGFEQVADHLGPWSGPSAISFGRDGKCLSRIRAACPLVRDRDERHSMSCPGVAGGHTRWSSDTAAGRCRRAQSGGWCRPSERSRYDPMGLAGRSGRPRMISDS